MDSQPALNRPVDAAVIERLFMALHGYFGNQFLDKFRLGEQSDGKDLGIENAKRIWMNELAGFGALEVMGALRKIRDLGGAFPPSLPEFSAACMACRRRASEPVLALPAPTPGRARERLIAYRERLKMRPAGGLATLFAVTAKAVADAGGDEVATLRRLESDFMRAKS